jgi:hypothetical protein
VQFWRDHCGFIAQFALSKREGGWHCWRVQRQFDPVARRDILRRDASASRRIPHDGANAAADCVNPIGKILEESELQRRMRRAAIKIGRRDADIMGAVRQV